MIGVTPAAITQYELGQTKPSPDVLARIGIRLGLPVDFFEPGRPPNAVDPASAHFRSLRATTQTERLQAIAFGQIALEVLAAIELWVELPAPQLPHLELDPELTIEGVAGAAKQTRQHLGLPLGPVGHVVRTLEAHGVLVLRLPEMTRRVDAFSTHYGKRPAVFLNPVKSDRARARFDAAHELGHLVMHHDAEPGTRPVENQAHAFAAEFLMPADEVEPDLPRRIDWDQFHHAKRKWGTSLKALVYRAKALGLLTEYSYKRAMMQLAQWGDPEPGTLGPAESPTMVGAAIRLLEESGHDLASIATAAGLPVSLVDEIREAGSDPRPVLAIG